jgi:hypothetical protein
MQEWMKFSIALPSHTPSLKLLDLASILKALAIEYSLLLDESRDCDIAARMLLS